MSDVMLVNEGESFEQLIDTVDYIIDEVELGVIHRTQEGHHDVRNRRILVVREGVEKRYTVVSWVLALWRLREVSCNLCFFIPRLDTFDVDQLAV